jgi:hypothetical protein
MVHWHSTINLCESHVHHMFGFFIIILYVITWVAMCLISFFIIYV